MRVLSRVVHSITGVFGCTHDRMSRPFTIQSQTYMVCLECGRKVFYSPEEMRRLSRGEVRRMQSKQAHLVELAPLPGQAAAEKKDGPVLAA